VIDWTPQPIAFSVGPLAVHWYGIMYAIGLAATYVVVEREARRRSLDTGLLVNGFILIAFAALVGGRLYHVIDQWDARYRNDLLAIVMPPYSGLGVYGGIATGFLAAVLYTRWKHTPFLGWADAAAPGLLVMQGIARWGNFFNQELYGPPTNLPWGIAIQCANRTQAWACPQDGGTTPVDAHFVPLFLYESISGLIGAAVLILLARRVRSLRPGDLVLLFFAWYGTTRFLLEPLRTNNWMLGGIPTASIISAAAVVGALLLLAWRHRPGAAAGDQDAPNDPGGTGDTTLADVPGSAVPVGAPGSAVPAGAPGSPAPLDDLA
jgi:phosphatidylglycerol:prolipoprotein diacylglycerol transferase